MTVVQVLVAVAFVLALLADGREECGLATRCCRPKGHRGHHAGRTWRP